MSNGAHEVQLKFDRSRWHLAELERGISSYLAADPFSVSPEEEANGDLVYRARVNQLPPVQLSLPLGDAIHSARSALDYLAWQLVIAGGGTPGKQTAFPISVDQNKFETAVKEKLSGASQAVITAVDELKAFDGGDENFWRLHQLDIEDKHHLLVPVGIALAVVNVEFGLPGMDPIKVGLTPINRAYPLQNGTEVFRVMQAARESADSGIGGNPSFDFDVAFGEGVIVKGEPIFPTLVELIGSVERAVLSLFRFLR